MKLRLSSYGKMILTLDGVVALVGSIIGGPENLAQFVTRYAANLAIAAAVVCGLLAYILVEHEDALSELPDDDRAKWVLVGLCFIPAAVAAWFMLPLVEDVLTVDDSEFGTAEPFRDYIGVGLIIVWVGGGSAWLIAQFAPAAARAALGSSASPPPDKPVDSNDDKDDSDEHGDEDEYEAPALNAWASTPAADLDDGDVLTAAAGGAEASASTDSMTDADTRIAEVLASLTSGAICPACGEQMSERGCSYCGQTAAGRCAPCDALVELRATRCERCGAGVTWLPAASRDDNHDEALRSNAQTPAHAPDPPPVAADRDASDSPRAAELENEGLLARARLVRQAGHAPGVVRYAALCPGCGVPISGRGCARCGHTASAECAQCRALLKPGTARCEHCLNGVSWTGAADDEPA